MILITRIIIIIIIVLSHWIQTLFSSPTLSGDARKIMHECRQLEEQTQRTQRQVLKATGLKTK